MARVPAVHRPQVIQPESQFWLVAHRYHVVDFAAPDPAGYRVAAQVTLGPVRVVDKLTQLPPPETAFTHHHSASMAEGKETSGPYPQGPGMTGTDTALPDVSGDTRQEIESTARCRCMCGATA